MEEAKMFINLIVVDSKHFIRYKCKIVLDGNEKLSINEMQWNEVLIGVGTFTSANSLDTQSLHFVTMNELKKSM